jgi:predicted transcriptional regulator
MPALSDLEKRERYYKIFCQLYENPRTQIYEISKALGIYRKSVSRALQEMIDQQILVGPQLRLKPMRKKPTTYYLLDFDDPFRAYERLKKHKNLTYIGVVFGDFPIIAAGDPGMDFDDYPGFNRVLITGERGEICTPRASSLEWEECADRILEEIEKSDSWEKSTWASRPVDIPWDHHEWEFFHEFGGDIRRKIAPLVREREVSFRKFYEWLNDLDQYTTIHTGFYPEGYASYTTYLFLFKTGYEHAVIDLFSLLPTTSMFFKVGSYLLTWIYIRTDPLIISLSRAIYALKEKYIIDKFYKGIVVMRRD